MSTLVVGVDTAVCMTAEVQPGMTYLQDVTSWLGGRPPLVIRPLGTGGVTASGKPVATPVTTKEINDVRAAGVAQMFYYNDSRLNGLKVSASAEQGVFEAKELLAQADAVGVPDGTYVPIDIEYGVTENPKNTPQALAAYITAVADTIRPTRLAGAGGFYANMGPGSLFAKALMLALSQDQTGNVHRLILWPADWIVGAGGFTLTNPPTWDISRVPAEIAGMVRLVQVSGGDFGGWFDLSLVDPALLNPGGGTVLPLPLIDWQARALAAEAQVSAAEAQANAAQAAATAAAARADAAEKEIAQVRQIVAG